MSVHSDTSKTSSCEQAVAEYSRNVFETMSALVETDRNLTIRELAQDTGLAPSTEIHILKDHLKMPKIASKWVPRDLTDTQK
ncbi:hypothetical protein ANN_04045 [Periplaneta americana]|uniref:Uncharacterized protein n=1 Tax=Periplaneta americana TaxID=6978 RepID=A0ABQ8T8Y2_PERAM|nr:hypothetical protein ANN_04045 [Periplaneta americana]